MHTDAIVKRGRAAGRRKGRPTLASGAVLAQQALVAAGVAARAARRSLALLSRHPARRLLAAARSAALSRRRSARLVAHVRSKCAEDTARAAAAVARAEGAEKRAAVRVAEAEGRCREQAAAHESSTQERKRLQEEVRSLQSQLRTRNQTLNAARGLAERLTEELTERDARIRELEREARIQGHPTAVCQPPAVSLGTEDMTARAALPQSLPSSQTQVVEEEEEGAGFFRFGMPGGGAPLRNKDGSVIANVSWARGSCVPTGRRR